MPNFHIFLRGYNFPGHLIGEDRTVGFYTNRWVRALSAKRAELKAVQMVWDDPMLESLEFPQNNDDRAYIRLEEIEKIDRLPKNRGGGATWFLEEDK